MRESSFKQATTLIDMSRAAKAAQVVRAADDGVVLVNGADLNPESVQWLWRR